MKKRLISLVLLLSIGITTNAATQAAQLDADNLSFIVSAQEAQLTQLKSGQYRLLLEGVNPYVIYYTRRPNRGSGLASVGNFLKAWSAGQHSFQQDAPNATLTSAIIEGATNKEAAVKVLQLSSPQYNVRNNSMSFIVAPVNDDPINIKQLNYLGVNIIIN